MGIHQAVYYNIGLKQYFTPLSGHWNRHIFLSQPDGAVINDVSKSFLIALYHKHFHTNKGIPQTLLILNLMLIWACNPKSQHPRPC